MTATALAALGIIRSTPVFTTCDDDQLVELIAGRRSARDVLGYWPTKGEMCVLQLAGSMHHGALGDLFQHADGDTRRSVLEVIDRLSATVVG